MASLVTTERYQVITLDTTSAASAVSAALETAEDLIEDYLRRPIPVAQRTETLPMTRSRRVYPTATPISAVAAGSGLEIEGSALVGASPNESPFLDWNTGDSAPLATVTYTGGWSASTLPKTIEKHIAWFAYELLHVGNLDQLDVTSVKVGDVSVSFAEPADSGASVQLSAGAKRELRPYQRRRV